MNEEKLTQDVLGQIEKIRLQLIQRISKGNFSNMDIAEISAQIDFFEELQSLGYGDVLEGYFQNYETIIKEIKATADRLGVRNIIGASVRDLDAFIDVKFDELLGRARQYGKEIKSELLKNLIAGVNPNEIADNLNQIPLTNTQLRVAVNTGIAEFERLGTAKVFEDAPETRFRLEGADDIRTRPSCKSVLRYQPKEGWTKEEIDNGAATKIVKEHAQEFAQSRSELEQALKNPYGFANCGGFNCRHRFRVVENSDIIGEVRTKNKTITESDRRKIMESTQIELPDRVIEPLNRIEYKIRKQKKESFYILDQSGNIVLEKSGDIHRVQSTLSEARLMENKIVTHNHPGIYGVDDLPLSSDDIINSFRFGAKEFRAVSKNKTYRFYQDRASTKGGLAFEKYKADELFNNFIQEEMDKLSENPISKQMLNARGVKKKRLETELYIIAQEKAIERFAREFGWVYESLNL